MTYYIIARISFLIRVVVFSLTKRSLMPVRLVASRIPFLSAYWFGQHSQLLDKAEKSIDFSSRDISNLYLLIREVSFDQRNLVALNLKNSLISKSAGKLNQNHFAFVDRVQKQGYLILKDCIDSEKIDECLQFFQRNQNLDGQVWPQAMPDWPRYAG